jgi:transcriptional regulator with PAS, ATPase and Fis domain
MKQIDHLEMGNPALKRWLRSVGAEAAFTSLAQLLPGAALFAVDKERNIVLWNDAAEYLLGFKRAEVVGQHCLKANRCESCMTGCGIAEHGRLEGVPLTLFNATGAPVKVRKYAQAFFDEQGAFAGGIEILLPHERPAEAPALRKTPAQDAVPFHAMLSRDPAMLQVFGIIRNVARSDATVLLRGESGVGKELAARALHDESHRRNGPFLTLNCAALAPNLLEDELFGHMRGAFPGAIKDQAGVFERAHGGTLFLDDVAELPPELQAKLLRVLEERKVTRAGGNNPISVDVRVVAATHRSLREQVRLGRFREDLLYRLRVVPVYLPPLRERRGDVPLLLWHFIEQRNARETRRIERIAPEAMRVLLDYHWPGNVRELQTVLEYAFAVGRGSELVLQDLPPEFRATGAPVSTGERAPLQDEAQRIRIALRETRGHTGKAAALLGVSRATLWRKRKQLGINGS